MTGAVTSTPVRLIEDYAMIGSTHSAALVHRSGTIEWLCLPRFDSDAIFVSLLGTPDHGGWLLGAKDASARVSRRYLPDTLVLETTVETDTGTALIIDFMPPPARDGVHEVVRIVRGVKGRVSMATDLRVRFNYGESTPWVEEREGALFFVAGSNGLRLSTSVPLTVDNLSQSANFEIVEGQEIAASLDWFPSHEEPPLPRDPFALLRHTEAAWRRWMDDCTYDGPYRDAVRRSLLTLKGLTYAPTGGIVAAPTTSLPEDPGGVRNWDYRYCWLRDAIWTIHALAQSGYRQEASDWRWWLMRATAGAPGDVQIMYGLHGERRLIETELEHLPGYENSRPVRLGNGAHDQLQLDIYGSLLGAFNAAPRAGIADMDKVWAFECAVGECLLTRWREPDSGLWEVRGPPRHFVYSKLMCWLAFDRMIASAEEFGLDGPVDAWRAERDAIHSEICEKGFDAESNSFVQYYGADRVDAALLQMPLLGFLPATDPRVRGTVARIEAHLLRDGLVYRYLTDSEEADGLPGDEGAFLACSFWLADAWLLDGRKQEAVALFERLLSYGNDLGLFAEEYDPRSQRLLGNFPQAFTHFALVNTAHLLEATDQGGSPVDAMVWGRGRRPSRI